MRKTVRSRVVRGVLVGAILAGLLSLIPGMLGGVGQKAAEAQEMKLGGMFVNLVSFSSLKPGKEAEFLEWFRWSNELYARHKGFISRTLLRPTDGRPIYAAIVEHESKETFTAMHHSPDREEAFRRVAPLFAGKPTPHFYEVVVSSPK